MNFVNEFTECDFVNVNELTEYCLKKTLLNNKEIKCTEKLNYYFNIIKYS